jgi:hypothetical protein
MLSPDFNITDYAVGFDRIGFGDRYLHLPLLRLSFPSYKYFLQPRPDAEKTLTGKTDFCAYVMSNNTNSAPERVQIYDLLSRHKKVNSGGSWRNNVGGPVTDKLAFQFKHKFVIAFENTSFPGYLTEKFSEAAASNAIPIYWGDPDIGRLFNPKAFVNCHDLASIEDVADRVAEIDNNDELYLEMLREPWFNDGIEPPEFCEKSFVHFLTNIFEQPPKSAFRRPRGRWGIKYERALTRAMFRPHEQLIKNIWRRNKS